MSKSLSSGEVKAGRKVSAEAVAGHKTFETTEFGRHRLSAVFKWARFVIWALGRPFVLLRKRRERGRRRGAAL